MKTDPSSSASSRLRRPLGAVRIAAANVRRVEVAGDPDSLECGLSILDEALGEMEESLRQLPRSVRRRLRKRYRDELGEAELALFEGSSKLSQAEDFLGELVKATNATLVTAE